MNNDADRWADFSAHISYQARLGIELHWASLQSAETAAPASDMRVELGISLLETLLSRGEPWHAQTKDDSQEELLGQLNQLRARLDVMTAILDRLDRGARPAPVEIRLNEYGCALDLQPPSAVEQAVELHLHFEGCQAVPLVLTGCFSPARPGFVAFQDLHPALAERIGKLAFRQHRLHIAAHRGR